jgi:hypothetical protein
MAVRENPWISSTAIVPLNLLARAAKRLARLPCLHWPTALEPIGLAVPALGILDGCIAIEGGGLDPCAVWIFRRRADHARCDFPIGRDVRNALALSVGRNQWALSSLDRRGQRTAPVPLEVELAAAVIDALANYLPVWADTVLEDLERTFVIPAVPRVGILRLESFAERRLHRVGSLPARFDTEPLGVGTAS